MRDIQFVKMQGAGNDFVVIDARAGMPDGVDLVQLARQMCDRHYGVGADGIIIVLASDKANYRMRVINPDGSEAEMCGNGIRCFARYVWEKSEDKKEVISVETPAGIKIPAVIIENGNFSSVEVDMGIPVVEALQESLTVEGVSYKINKISTGNPHCVIFVDDPDNVDLGSIGPIIENLPQFPNRTNVEFVQVKNKKELVIKVWERGAGETLACGTGACASAVASISNNLTENKVIAHLPGGDLTVEWADDKHIIMRGPAEFVFEGKYLFEG